jgi:serine phosphatase RsbU (regulator of sigma subunit)
LAPGRWLFWVADATGHGVAAALFTSLVAHLFHLAGSACTTASGVLARVNAEFFSALRGHSFMTAACVVIDTAGYLTFAGAGHPPLLIRRADGTVERVAPLGLMMGLHATMEPDETGMHLASGDVALLYTDGLFSLPDATGERSTIATVADALAQLKPGSGVPARLIAQLGPQNMPPAFDDDMAVVALRRT